MAETEAINEPEVNETPIQGMRVEVQVDPSSANGGLKRDREEAVESEEDNIEPKKLKVDKPDGKNLADEKSEEQTVTATEAEAELKQYSVTVGPKSFRSSVEMFDYFYKFLHFWTPNINVNKFEYLMLLELLKKGHLGPDQKIGVGIKAFQVRFHPRFRSRCFFLVREDNSMDDFSFRKCVDHILPLPENMQVKHDVNRVLGGGRGGRGGCHFGRGGRGRGARWKVK